MLITDLPSEIIEHILNFCEDSDQLSLIECSKTCYEWRYLMRLRTAVSSRILDKTSYFDSFENVSIVSTLYLLPKKIKKIKLNWIRTIDISQYNIEEIVFGDSFDSSIAAFIPASTIKIDFGKYFSKPFSNLLPHNIRQLIIGPNSYLENSIPRGITHLTLGYDFNSSIRNVIPDTVSHLVFGDRYNRSIEFNSQPLIPVGVKHLVFGFKFNQQIVGYMPPDLDYVRFGSRFNAEVVGAFKLVRKIHFGNNFSREVLGAFPLGLKCLTFGDYFNQPIKDALPEGLVELKFGLFFNQDIMDAIPNSVRILKFKGCFDSRITEVPIPVITCLESVMRWNYLCVVRVMYDLLNLVTNGFWHGFFSKNYPEINYAKMCYQLLNKARFWYSALPPRLEIYQTSHSKKNLLFGGVIDNIQILKLSRDFNNSIVGIIPSSVQELEFGNMFNQPIRGFIPHGVRCIVFGDHFNQSIYRAIPNSVTHLTFGNQFDQDIRECLPDGLIYLKFGEEFNKPVQSALPGSLIHLIFGYNFNQQVARAISNSVQRLIFGKKFVRSLSDVVPDSVIYLSLSEDYVHQKSLLRGAIPHGIRTLKIWTLLKKHQIESWMFKVCSKNEN